MRLDVPQSRYGLPEERKISCLWRDSEMVSPYLLARGKVTVAAKLPQIFKYNENN
jgi:hypothetical protein